MNADMINLNTIEAGQNTNDIAALTTTVSNNMAQLGMLSTVTTENTSAISTAMTDITTVTNDVTDLQNSALIEDYYFVSPSLIEIELPTGSYTAVEPFCIEADTVFEFQFIASYFGETS